VLKKVKVDKKEVKTEAKPPKKKKEVTLKTKVRKKRGQLKEGDRFKEEENYWDESCCENKKKNITRADAGHHRI